MASQQKNNFTHAWSLISAYWRSEEKVSAYSALVIVIALTLLLVAGSVMLTYWYKYFWDAVQAYNKHDVVKWLVVFCVLVTFMILVAVYQYYLQSVLTLRWRRWLTKTFIKQWVTPQHYYYLENFDDNRSDNPDQRIQEDIDLLTSTTLSLFLGIVQVVTTLPAFTLILWHLSGMVTLPLGRLGQIHLRGYLVWVSLIYSIGGTYITHLIGKPLININFLKQKREADFRFRAVRLRNNAENIALYRAEKTEAQSLADNFKQVVAITMQLIQRQKRLLYFTAGFNQIALIIPLIAALPLYFTKKIGIGGMQQILGAFRHVQDAFSFIVSAYTQIAIWRATTVRLTGFAQRLQRAEQLKARSHELTYQTHDAEQISAQNLQITTQAGTTLFQDLTVTFNQGQHCLIKGPSGTGKTTLIRTLAGIWPFAKGTVKLPRDKKVMIVPQRAYLPLGTLRDAILYPGDVTVDDEVISALLTALRLEKFIGQLDDEQNWTEHLSVGEQQRIAFARVILQRPDWVFLDESTSSLDRENEENVYRLLKQRLPQCTLISVAHRDSLRAQHDVELALQPAT